MIISEKKFILTIDVEDWFQVENLKKLFPFSSWQEKWLRIERNIELILNLLSENRIKATFFVLGWIAKKNPELIRKLDKENHEIACHGYSHRMLHLLDKKTQCYEIEYPKKLLEDITGKEVIGFRAPTFSINKEIIEKLQQKGYQWDSSLFLGRSPWKCKIKNKIFNPFPKFFEIPIPILYPNLLKIPVGGGGYFRLFPYEVWRKMMNKFYHTHGYYLFYLHPWELDPFQPRVKGVSFLKKFMHYKGLKKTPEKFKILLKEFKWIRVKDILKSYLPAK